MTKEELDEQYHIDTNNLDLECNKQLTLFSAAGEELVKALDKRDTAKHRLTVISAQLAVAYRANSIEKVTENKVEEHVNSHPDVITQLQFIDQYSNEVKIWELMVNKMELRKYMLRELCGLHQTAYFGTGITNDSKIEALKAAYARRVGATDDK